MIKSEYINDILDLLLDSDEEGLLTRKQIPFLTEKNFDYTDSGVFVYFEHKTGVEKFKAEKQDLVLDGLKIYSSEYQIEAQATLFFKEGIIDNLEIWCYVGDYPKSYLNSYTITQTWLNSNNKTITRP